MIEQEHLAKVPNTTVLDIAHTLTKALSSFGKLFGQNKQVDIGLFTFSLSIIHYITTS